MLELVPRVRSYALLGVVVACFLGLGAVSAGAAVRWTAKASWGDTNLPPGGNAQLVLLAQNLGDSLSSGTVTLQDSLPTGVTVTGFELPVGGWTCFGVGGKTATCQSSSSAYGLYNALLPGESSYLPRILVNLAVLPSVSGTKTNCVSVVGGGAVAATVPPTPCAATPVAAYDADPMTFDATPSEFGFVPGGFNADVLDAPRPDGLPERTAGSHPFELQVDFDLNEMHGIDPRLGDPYTNPIGRVRTVETVLPRGLVGNPEALPKCDPLTFARVKSATTTECPANTQVGYLDLELSEGADAGGFGGIAVFPGNFVRIPVYNLVPPKGQLADFGFTVVVVQNHIYPTLDPAHDYAIKALTPYISDLLSVRGARFTMWGVPGDPAHDSLRADPHETGGAIFGAPFEGPIRPLLTLPMDCGVENGPFLQDADSWNHPGLFTPVVSSTREVMNPVTRKVSFEEDPLNVHGCEDPRIRFEPRVRLQPTSRAAGGPTGLTVHLEVPQRDQTVEDVSKLYAQNGSIHGIDTPPMKEAVVTLPEGMTLSTSAGQGLGGCTLAEIGIGTDSPVTCPEDSRYGQLVIHSPALPKDEPLVGDIYIAKQSENPFHNFLAMYFVIHDESRGVLVKLAGKIELNQETGQIKTIFDDLPQFPVSDLELSIKGGVRAGLVNPQTCGEKRIKAEFFSWSEPDTPVVRESAYDVTEKPDGTACVNSLSERPFGPELGAGTLSNSAASYSPFEFRLTRTDDDQEFSQLNITLPPGLTGKLIGVAKCSDAGIAQAISRTGAGDGAREVTDPSCPASSQIGTSEVGTGVGQVISYIAGKVYLAGPYQGAPLSVVVISPILVGPYDLGVVAVRSALEVNPNTTQVSVKSEPFPKIYQGIPVRIRDIRVNIDRPEFTFNPTNCDPMTVNATVSGAQNTIANMSSRYQAANCSQLAFKPSFKVSTSGKTSRANGASLTVHLAYPNAPQGSQANIRSVKVDLPKQLPSRLTTLQKACPDSTFSKNPAACPAASRVGTAVAITPILPEPLAGPAYFVSHGGAKFPELILVIQGYGLTIDLHGETFINEKTGVTSSTFATVPDAPVTSFELTLPQGPNSALAATGNLCAVTKTVLVKHKLKIRSKGHTHTTTRKIRQTIAGSLTMPTAFTAQNGMTIKQTTPIAVTGCGKKAISSGNTGRRRHRQNKTKNKK